MLQFVLSSFVSFMCFGLVSVLCIGVGAFVSLGCFGLIWDFCFGLGAVL